MILLFTYIKLMVLLPLYYFTEYEMIFDVLLLNIKKSGSVLIKFCQWSIPRLNEMYNLDQKKIQKLEELYERCNFHSMEYTEKIYQKNFHESIYKKYDSIEEIASGSIGQVYRMKDKEGEAIALKIIHPNIDCELRTFQYILYLINLVKPIRDSIKYYFPINLTVFLEDFNSQTNLINEANNNLLFASMYRNNEYIIIPELITVSKQILIMKYEEGKTYRESDYSYYLLKKIILLQKLFTKNNEIIHRFTHGDLHRGNWKIRQNNSDIKLIIYDFGFCWKVPPFLYKNSDILNDSLYNLSIKTTINDSNIDELAKVANIFCEEKYDRDEIRSEIIKLLDTERMSIVSPKFFIKLCLNISRKYSTFIHPTIINCLIIHSQVNDLYKIIIDNNFQENEDYNKHYFTYNYIGSLINICDTYNIFTELRETLVQDFTILQKQNRMNHIFIDNRFSENKKLKLACIT